MDTQRRVALVTGGARGIGKGICAVLAHEGARVVIADVELEEAGAVATRLTADGGDARALFLDVSDVNSLEAKVDEVIRDNGPLSLLVNNAGIITLNPVLEMTEAEWDSVFSVNTKGVFFLSQAVARAMIRDAGGGAIVNVSSIGAKIPFAGQAHYCASKAAVLGLTRVLAVELAPHRITVNAICPGAVDGDVLKKSYLWAAKLSGENPETILRRWLEPVPLGRLITAEEIGALVSFLASEPGRTITGQSINIDGGRIFS